MTERTSMFRCGDIGEKEGQRTWEFEPLTVPETTEPVEVPEAEPVPEKVPA